VTVFDLYQPEQQAWVRLLNKPAGYNTSDISVLDASLSACGAPVIFRPTSLNIMANNAR